MFSDIVAVFFRIANFAVLIGLSVYLFKKYVYQSLLDQIAEKFAFIRGLKQKTIVLEEQKHELEESRSAQEVQCKRLVQQIKMWQHIIAQEEEKAQKERKERLAERKKRVALQASYLESERLKRMVLPDAIANAKKELSATFESEKPGHVFIKNILEQLKGKAS